MPKRKPARKPKSVTKRPAKSAPAAKPTPTKQPAASKQAKVLDLLRRPQGATIEAIVGETGWQQHSVRGFLAGVVRKRLKLRLSSTKADGKRAYRIAGHDAQDTTSPTADQASR
jgi:hypothetical protein